MNNLLSAISTILSGLPQGLLAISFGFSSISMGIAFLIGGFLNIFLQLVSPISFQAETITLVGTMGKNIKERISIIFFSSVIIFILGIFGILNKLIKFIGPEITNGMIAGVGILLARVSFNLFKENKSIGGVSIITGIISYIITKNLLITLLFSIFISSIINLIINPKKINNNPIKENIKFIKPTINKNIIRGSLAVACLNIGSNIAFGTMTAELSNSNINIDHLSILNGISNMVSSLLGGGPLGSIISITGEAPKPIFSATLMMVIMGIILLIGFLPKIGKYIPNESIAGFLFILGAAVTFPENAIISLSSNIKGGSLIGAVTLVTTSISDPFIGMIIGIIFKLFLN